MTNEEILKKSIEKVVRNGWRWLEFDKELTLATWNLIGCKNAIRRGDMYFVIFSPSFAKAYWGERINTIKSKDLAEDLQFDYVSDDNEHFESQFMFVAWKYHQHIMLDYVQDGKNPLLYLRRFLDDKN